MRRSGNQGIILDCHVFILPYLLHFVGQLVFRVIAALFVVRPSGGQYQAKTRMPKGCHYFGRPILCT
jgi:hypothetical protein